MRRAWSDITVTDVFCGAGGNTIGAKKAGLRVRVGLNHWKRAIETYGTNNPEVDVVERVDVSLCDPRRYPSTDIGIFSPECTTHSPAGGNRHARAPQQSLFNREIDPATVRSRVTMFDVVRFTEYHRYRIVVVENVVEATRWELFADWLRMMDNLGYEHRILSLNSMFFHPTPQSRDRIYVVFWQKGNRSPLLEYRPLAPCAKCGIVEAVQAWKPNRGIGKYRRQYVYLCSGCAGEVTPFYYAALNALVNGQMNRRVYGTEEPLGTQAASRVHDAVVTAPGFVVETAQTHSNSGRPRDLSEPLPTLSAQQSSALVSPFIISAGSRETMSRGTDPMPTQTGSERLGVVSPFVVPMMGNAVARGVDDSLPTQMAECPHDALISPTPFIIGLSHGSGRGQSAEAGDPLPAQTTAQDLAMVVPLRTNGRARDVAEELPAVAAHGQHHMLVQGAAQLSMRDANAMRVAGLDKELMTQGCGPQAALIQRSPFLVSYYGNDIATPADGVIGSITTIDRHAAVTPELRAEDCYFRMLQPHEIGAAMAFPGDYIVGGTKRDRVKQYGNAVTPPVMDWIVRQCAATLAPELDGGEVA